MNAPIDPVRRTTKTDALLRHIEGLGLDKNFRAIGIRTCALAAATGVPTNSIQALLTPHIKSGRILVCKVTEPGSMTQNEYRKGSGVAAPEHVPLNPKRAGVAMRCEDIRIPQLIKQPQPAVGNNTGSSAIGLPPATPSPEAPAVAAPATPKPEVRVELKKEPAARKASAGDVVDISIDADGRLIISTDEGVIELQQKQTLRLGHFLVGSQSIWNPF